MSAGDDCDAEQQMGEDALRRRLFELQLDNNKLRHELKKKEENLVALNTGITDMTLAAEQTEERLTNQMLRKLEAMQRRRDQLERTLQHEGRQKRVLDSKLHRVRNENAQLASLVQDEAKKLSKRLRLPLQQLKEQMDLLDHKLAVERQRREDDVDTTALVEQLTEHMNAFRGQLRAAAAESSSDIYDSPHSAQRPSHPQFTPTHDVGSIPSTAPPFLEQTSPNVFFSLPSSAHQPPVTSTETPRRSQSAQQEVTSSSSACSTPIARAYAARDHVTDGASLASDPSMIKSLTREISRLRKIHEETKLKASSYEMKLNALHSQIGDASDVKERVTTELDEATRSLKSTSSEVHLINCMSEQTFEAAVEHELNESRRRRLGRQPPPHQ